MTNIFRIFSPVFIALCYIPSINNSYSMDPMSNNSNPTEQNTKNTHISIKNIPISISSSKKDIANYLDKLVKQRNVKICETPKYNEIYNNYKSLQKIIKYPNNIEDFFTNNIEKYTKESYLNFCRNKYNISIKEIEELANDLLKDNLDFWFNYSRYNSYYYNNNTHGNYVSDNNYLIKDTSESNYLFQVAWSILITYVQNMPQNNEKEELKKNLNEKQLETLFWYLNITKLNVGIESISINMSNDDLIKFIEFEKSHVVYNMSPLKSNLLQLPTVEKILSNPNNKKIVNNNEYCSIVEFINTNYSTKEIYDFTNKLLQETILWYKNKITLLCRNELLESYKNKIQKAWDRITYYVAFNSNNENQWLGNRILNLHSFLIGLGFCYNFRFLYENMNYIYEIFIHDAIEESRERNKDNNLPQKIIMFIINEITKEQNERTKSIK